MNQAIRMDRKIIETYVDDANAIDNVYIEAFREDSDQFSVNLEGLITLFVYNICQTDKLILHIKFLEEKPTDYVFYLYNNEVKFQEIKNEERYLKCLIWPIIYVDNVVIGGLCSVARQLIKSSRDECCRRLLGFREACLIACSENSVWTKFCEIDAIQTIKDIMLKPADFVKGNTLELPQNICRFEHHMTQPIRIHNIYKWARQASKDKSLDSKTPIDKLAIDHKYSEGPFMTLADVILFPPFHVFFNYYRNVVLEDKLPLTFAWYSRMKDKLPDLNFRYQQFDDCTIENIIEPPFLKQSLYKADPKRYKPEKRMFTKQNIIEKAIKTVKESSIVIHNEYKPYGPVSALDWNGIPVLAGPIGGSLPEKRLDRKCQQLENMANAVLKVARNRRMVIVDFCSGGGHLGILLAYLMPSSNIILVENKEQSLLRASERVEVMQMKNIFLYQGNLDYFKHPFHLGVSLHACGSATDLVIQKSIEKNAHFICCPCCYGGIKDCHDLTYPKSEEFKKLSLDSKEYFSMAHAADQTHGAGNAKTEQGYYCMDVIDTDRKLHAESQGYDVFLGKLQPLTCTNKNNLLVGINKKLT